MQLRQLLKCKLHHAHVSYANPDYVGSIEIDGEIMDRAGLFDGELVHVWAVDHRSRITTYAFRGPKGAIGLNGGAAHHFSEGDRLVIASFVLADEPVEPTVLLLNERNEIVREMTPFQVVD